MLITLHRRENIGNGIKNICLALYELAINHSNLEIVIPVHLNPNIQKPITDYLGNINNIKLIEPQDYLSFIFLLQKSQLIITDSGGLQEEAANLRKPVLITRNITERPESLNETVKLIGTDKTLIIEEVNHMLSRLHNYASIHPESLNTPELILEKLHHLL